MTLASGEMETEGASGERRSVGAGVSPALHVAPCDLTDFHISSFPGLFPSFPDRFLRAIQVNGHLNICFDSHKFPETGKRNSLATLCG